MKLFITGANGFLGKYVVAEALRRGHSVRAVARSAKDAERNGWIGHPRIEVAQTDLRRKKGLADHIRGCDAVLHLAAAKGGDVYDQFAGTVVSTENLLAAMEEAAVHRITLCSTFSVYDCHNTALFGMIDEHARVEPDAMNRDGYALTKLIQERLVRQWCTERKWPFTVIRPGVIYGRDNLENGWAGMKGGRLWIRTGAWATIPLTYVENCAEAIVRTVETESAVNQIINVVDDEMPSQRKYINLLRKRMSPKPIVVPVSYTMMQAIAGSASLFNRWFCGGKAKIPSIFVPCRLAARAKPLRYSNALAKKLLDWTPRFGLKEALDRSTSERDAALDAVRSEARSAETPDSVKGAA